jgi:hypothetical protein
MVGGTLQHLRALRRMESDHGWIRTLLDEAENERMHLMTFIQIAQPSSLERLLVLLAQGVFYNLFFLLYVISPKTAHLVVGYFEEEAVFSYTEYLAGVDDGTYANVTAPKIAIEYWKLAPDARLRDVSSSRSARMKRITATSITNLPTSCPDQELPVAALQPDRNPPSLQRAIRHPPARRPPRLPRAGCR